jgi:hypothetical protein
MHENFLSYIMIGLNRGFTLPMTPQRGRRWDGGEYFSPEQRQPAASQLRQKEPSAENLPAIDPAKEAPTRENPVKSRSCPSDRQLARLRHPWRLSWPSLCR